MACFSDGGLRGGKAPIGAACRAREVQQPDIGLSQSNLWNLRAEDKIDIAVISKDVYNNMKSKGGITNKIIKAKDDNKNVTSKDNYNYVNSKGGIINESTKAKDDNNNVISKDACDNRNSKEDMLNNITKAKYNGENVIRKVG